MNKNEFLIVTGLSGLVVVLLFLQVLFGRLAAAEQTRAMQAQQFVQQGQVALRGLQQVAMRTAQLSQQTGDQSLKDLMQRQNIAIGQPPAAQGSDNNQPAPATPPPAPAH